MAHTLDTRDLVQELEELEAKHTGDPDAQALISQLQVLFEEIWGYAGDSPEDGVQLIPDENFTEYAQELHDDLSDGHRREEWPYTCIDWEWAARELRMDYTSVEFDGVTYWYR